MNPSLDNFGRGQPRVSRSYLW